MKKIILPAFSATILTLPLIVSAQLSGTGGLIDQAGTLVNQLTILVAGVALLVFFWGLAKFILKIGGDAKAVAEGKQLMIWGVIALFVMVSIWGIIYFIGGEIFGGRGNSNDFYVAPNIPVFSR